MSDIYASVDLGGTKVAVSLGREDGTIINEKVFPTESYMQPESVIAQMAETVNALAVEAGQKPTALGMGIPGLAHLAKGEITRCPNLPGWVDVPARELLAPSIGCPVYVLNDVCVATLGELTYGHGKGADPTMAFFALGTGIGGGLAVDGKLRLGPIGAAGELGHQTIVPDGPTCGCGNRGCLEALAAGPAITGKGVWLLSCGRAPKLYEIVGGDASKVTPKEMAQAAEAGDDDVREVLVRAFEYLGIGIANMVTSLHPDLVVLGGSMAQIGDLLFDTVQATMEARVRMVPIDSVRVVPSAIGNDAGKLGGIALAMKQGDI